MNWIDILLFGLKPAKSWYDKGHMSWDYNGIYKLILLFLGEDNHGNGWKQDFSASPQSW